MNPTEPAESGPRREARPSVCSLLALGIPFIGWLGMLAAKGVGSNGAGGFAAGMSVMLLTIVVCGVASLVLAIAAFVRGEKLAFLPVLLVILALFALPK